SALSSGAIRVALNSRCQVSQHLPGSRFPESVHPVHFQEDTLPTDPRSICSCPRVKRCCFHSFATVLELQESSSPPSEAPTLQSLPPVYQVRSSSRFSQHE